jgi:lipoate-protein ligase A
MVYAEYKVPGGKLVAAEVEVIEGALSSVKITGDFFMHPEQVIMELEKALEGTHLSRVGEAVQGFFERNEVTLFGVEPSDFTHVLELCLNSGS